jgi:phosphoglycerate kinase
LQVLVRCDLNVPLDGKTITDDTRIRASIPTAKYLSDKGAKVLLASHLGRPKDGPEDKFSLGPVAPRLTELLGKEVKLAPDCIGDGVKACVDGMADGDIILAANADLFVNDAFGTAHRAHGSTEGVTKFVDTSVRAAAAARPRTPQPATARACRLSHAAHLRNSRPCPSRPSANASLP